MLADHLPQGVHDKPSKDQWNKVNPQSLMWVNVTLHCLTIYWEKGKCHSKYFRGHDIVCKQQDKDLAWFHCIFMLRHMMLCMYSIRTYLIHQDKLLFPVLLLYWKPYRSTLLNQMKDMKDVVCSGGVRFNSMSQSAKIGCTPCFVKLWWKLFTLCFFR